ncbi:MAG: MFS transporter [Candidatus Methanomethylophilaceae archaeon]|nr:MFS transporter [Candidatus Methanomethylophilaceae archaeon]
MSMSGSERNRAFAMWGLALCLTAAAAGWMFMRFGMVWSVVDLPKSPNIDYIVPAYVVSEVAMIPLGGKLADLFGARRVLSVAPLIFIAASMVCALSVSVEMLVAFRFVQGIGAGLILALAYTAVGKFYPTLKRGKVSELMTASFAVGSLFGSAAGYFLTENFNWRLGFMALSLMVAVGLALAWRFLPEDRGSHQKSDIVGMALAALVFGSATVYTQLVNVNFDLISVPSFAIAGLIVVGAVALVAHAKRSESPVIPVRIPPFERKVLVLMFIFSLCGLGLIQYFFKMYLTCYEFDIYKASAMFWLLIAGAAVPSMIGSRKVFSTGVRPWIIAGSAIVTAALILTHFIISQGILQFGISLFLFGFGLGFIVNQLICALQSVSDVKDMGQHTGNLMAIRMVGIFVGNAIVGSYISEVTQGNYVSVPIDLSVAENVLKEVAAKLMNDVQSAASSLSDGFVVSIAIMAAVTAILIAYSFTLGKDDVEAAEDSGKE